MMQFCMHHKPAVAKAQTEMDLGFAALKKCQQKTRALKQAMM